MIFVFLANGFEEAEAFVPVDVLRRAKIAVRTVGIGADTIIGAHGVRVIPDVLETDIIPNAECDGIVLPGGMPGTLNLQKSKVVENFIDYSAINRKVLAAICAAPSLLGRKGYLRDKTVTCYPGFEKQLIGANFVDLPVCTDGRIITAWGAGAAFEFSLAIVECIKGIKYADEIRESIRCVH